MTHGIFQGCVHKGTQRGQPTVWLLLALLVGLLLPAVAVADIGKNSCVSGTDPCLTNTGNINPTTSLSCADQIYPRRIAAFRAPATNGSGVLRTHKPL